MVNIPDEVKALFSSDTVRKNFHVRFPNGEYTDLNNENILSESVSFTESLCSQQYFKFGLAEASQIEFTAVGIPNVRGAYIECAIEIDCTRLGAAWASDNPVDPTLDFLTPQTCNYNGKLYFRVPYGRFKIDTCPRDHGAMWKRQITAFSDTLHDNTALSDFEQFKLKYFTQSAKVYKPNLVKLIRAQIPRENTGASLIASGYTKVLVDSMHSGYNGVTVAFTGIPVVGGSTITFTITIRMRGYRFDGDRASIDDIYEMDTVGYPYNSLLDALIEEFNSLGIDYEAAGYESMKDLILSASNSFEYALIPSIKLEEIYTAKGSNYSNEAYLLLNNEQTVLYPYRETVNKGNYGWMPSLVFQVPVIASIKVNGPTERQIIDIEPDITDLGVYRFDKDTETELDLIQLSFNATLDSTKKFNNVKFKVKSFENAYSFLDITKGFLEISGWFLKPNRNGGLDFFQMSENATATPVPASDWSSFWWDETPIESIGQVKVIYTENNEEQQQTFTIGDGNSVYTIENNEVLKASEMDMDTMQDILDEFFAPNAGVVNFTPVDLEMRGLPYLESGDYIELTAEDGETVETYILSQTINGIQHLTATITSTNGALLEVIENE